MPLRAVRSSAARCSRPRWSQPPDDRDAFWPDFAKECRRVERTRLNRVFNLDALTDRLDALVEAANAAEYLLMQVPAPHTAALAWKLDRILVWEDGEEHSVGWSRDYAGGALADAQRLAGRA